MSGNQTQRKNLLNALLEDTDLINTTNAQGEHLLLFFARTVGRQLVEQDNFPRRLSTKLRAPQALSGSAGGANGATGTSAGETTSTPESDLPPPKFAQPALLSLLGKWEPVKSLLQVNA